MLFFLFHLIGNWHQIIVTANNAGDKKIFVDDKLCSFSDAGTKTLNPSTNFFLGRSSYEGTLDELKIWDVELTPNEVKSLFNSYKSD